MEKESNKMTMESTEKVEAFLFAERLLCKRMPEEAVIREIKLRYACADITARHVINRVKTVWIKESESSRSEKKANALATLSHLTKMAIEHRDIKGAISVERLRAEIEGTLIQDNEMKESIQFEEWQNRSREELEFFTSHGCWPEELPQ